VDAFICRFASRASCCEVSRSFPSKSATERFLPVPSSGTVGEIWPLVVSVLFHTGAFELERLPMVIFDRPPARIDRRYRLLLFATMRVVGARDAGGGVRSSDALMLGDSRGI
jgi:hypothetical protein